MKETKTDRRGDTESERKDNTVADLRRKWNRLGYNKGMNLSFIKKR